MQDVFLKFFSLLLGLYWRVLRRPIVADLLYDENYTGLRWDRYFVLNFRAILRGYKKFTRNEVLALGRCSDRVKAQIDALSLSDYKGFSFNNINLWELCRASVLSDLNKLELDPSLEEDLEILKLYFVQAIKYLTGVRSVIDGDNITAILISQGTTLASRTAMEVSQRMGVTTVAMENSFVADRFYADNSTGIILNRHALASSVWQRGRARSLTDAQRTRLKARIGALYENKGKEHATNNSLGMKEIRERHNIPEDSRIAVFIAQVMTDASVIMDSEIFPNPIELIEETIKFFDKLDGWFLVVRLHPYESFGTTNSKLSGSYKMLDNITLRELEVRGLKGGKSYCIVVGRDFSTKSIMDEAALGITINSQAGLEMLMMGKPVVVCGRATYGNKGFTYDVPLAPLYFPVLEAATRSPVLSENQKDEIERFAYTLLFEYSFPKDIARLAGRFEDLFRRRQGYVGLIDSKEE